MCMYVSVYTHMYFRSNIRNKMWDLKNYKNSCPYKVTKNNYILSIWTQVNYKLFLSTYYILAFCPPSLYNIFLFYYFRPN